MTYPQDPNQPGGNPANPGQPSGGYGYPAAPGNGGYPPAPGYGGYPAAPGYGGYPQPQQTSNGLAVASLVCGIVGLLLFWFILGPLAIIFGAIGRSRANRGASGKGMATAGLVLGIVGLVGYIILIAVIVNDGGFVI